MSLPNVRRSFCQPLALSWFDHIWTRCRIQWKVFAAEEVVEEQHQAVDRLVTVVAATHYRQKKSMAAITAEASVCLPYVIIFALLCFRF